MIKSLLKIFVGVVLLLALAFYVLFVPSFATELTYRGERTYIRRDSSNIPTITTPSRQGYFYAMGRVHAEDRLFQMCFKILVIQGRLAEHVGLMPLPMDKFMREINLRGWGNRVAERLRRENKTEFDTFQAYVDGINDFAATLLVLPLDFHLIGLKWQNWTVENVLGIFKLLEWSQSVSLYDQYTRSVLLGQNYTKEQIEKLLPLTKKQWAFDSTVAIDDSLIPEELTSRFLKTRQNVPEFHPSVLQRYKEFGLFDLYKTAEGSNEWAISGKHTKSGQPLLVHDPHLQNIMPSQWYQIQAIYTHNGRNYSISGVSSSGLPIIVGKSDYFAMGITTIYMDNQDLYKQKIQGDRYLVNEKWIDLKIRQESIKIKTDKGVIEQVYKVRQTHRGPLIHYILASFGSYTVTEDISFAWTGFNDQYKHILATSHMSELRTLDEVKHSLLNESEYLFNVNIVFITKDGHIGYQQLGRYPIFSNPQASLYVKDGTTTDNDWLGFVPPAHRLQAIDPPSGYLVSSNNRIATEEYYNGLHGKTIFTARSDRLHQLISEGIRNGKKFDVNDMKEMVLDTVDVYCRQIIPLIKEAIPAADKALKEFDCNFIATSSQAAMYEVFFYNLHHLTKAHKTERMSILSMHPNAQRIFNYIKNSQKDEEKKVIMRSAWENMEKNLTDFFKTSDSKQWQWGKFHQDVMHHLPFTSSPLKFLYDRAFDGYGNMHTVNVGKMNKEQFANFQTSHRANYRAIFSYAEQNYWVIDSGSSEKIFSSHYDDQWELFRRNQFLTLVDPTPASPVSSDL